MRSSRPPSSLLFLLFEDYLRAKLALPSHGKNKEIKLSCPFLIYFVYGEEQKYPY